MKKARSNCCRQHYDTATYNKTLMTGKQKLLHIDVELEMGKMIKPNGRLTHISTS